MFRGDSDAEAQLKRRVASQDQAITNAGREYANLAQELKEEKALKRELEHKLNVEADKNVKNQAALYTKTEEYKTMAYLKVNLETSLLNVEKDLKKATVEIKRLEHQFDVATNKAATLASENTRLTQLAAPRPAPRASISTADRSTSNRFGYNPTPTVADTPSTSSSTNRPRPSSALGTYSSSTTTTSNTSGIKSRRSSISSSSIPTLKPTPAPAPVSAPLADNSKILSLERDVLEARSRNEVLEKEVTGLKTKLSNKERDLLTMENRVMAMEKEKKKLSEELSSRLEDATDEVKEGKRDLEKVKEKMRLEMVSFTNLMASDKKSFEEKITRMRTEVEKKESQVEKSDLLREQVEIKLSSLMEEIKGSKGDDGKALEALRAEKVEVETALVKVNQLLENESAKTLAIEESLEKVKEELTLARSQPEEELLKAQCERDELVAALGRAELAFAAASVVHLEATKSQLDEIVSLKSHLELFQSTTNGEEVDLLKTTLDELRSQLKTKDHEIAELTASNISDLTTATETIDTLELEKANIFELLSQAQSDLDTLPAALETSQKSLTHAQIEKESILVTLASMETKVLELSQSLAEFEHTKSELENLKVIHDHLNQTAQSQVERIKSLEFELEAVTTQAAELSSKIQALESLPSRSFDDSEVQQLQTSIHSLTAQAILAQDTITSLTREIESLESANIEVNGQQAIAVIDIKDLKSTVVELEVKLTASMESVNEEFLRAQTESENRIQEVEAIQSRNDEMEGQLSSTTLAWDDLQARYKSLEKNYEESQSTLTRLETVEVDLASTLEELETVKLAEKEVSASHLSVVGELNIRVAEQEEQIQFLSQSLKEIGVSLNAAEQRASNAAGELQEARDLMVQYKATTSASLSTANEKIESLEMELASEKKRIGEDITETSRRLAELGCQAKGAEEALIRSQATQAAATQQVVDASSRAESSEVDVIRLASELELATRRLANSEASLSTLQLELSQQLVVSTSIPQSSAPLSRSNSSDGTSDTTRQVILVTRLREERDELWSRLKFSRAEAEFRFDGLQERLALLEEEKGSELQDLESRLASAVDARVLSSEVSREALEKAKEDIEELKLELEMAESGLKEAESRLIDFERVSSEATALAIEFDGLLAKVASLEIDLLAATADTQDLRTKLFTATTNSVELKSTLIEVESELKLVSSASQEQTNSSLELDNLRATVTRLESEKVELHAKVLRRTQQIALNEQTIGLLRTNQLVADNEDNDDDTAEIPTAATSDNTFEQDLASISARLDVESTLRQEAESRLATITAELNTAREDLREAELVAQQSHEAHQASNILIQSNLEISQAAFSNLEREHTTTSSTLATLEITYADSHQQYLADRAVLTAALQTKSNDVAKALEKIATLETSVLQLTQSQGMNDQVVSEHASIVAQLKSELSESITNLEEATSQLQQSQLQVEQLGLDLGRMELEVIELRTLVAGHDDEIGDLVLELENITEVEKRQALEIQDLLLEVNTKGDALAQLELLRNEVQSQLAISEQTVHEMNSRLESALIDEETARQAAQEASASLLRLNERMVAEEASKSELESELSQLVQANQELTTISQKEMETLKAEIRHLHQERATLDRDLASTQVSLDASRDEVDRMIQQMKAADDEFELLRQDSRSLEGELEALQSKSSARLTELLERLEQLQVQKSEVETQLAAANERLSATTSDSPSNERVEELEKQLQEKAAEVEETDEKYIEVLKNQKKNLAQIERLRARCEGLQRDLTSLKAAGATLSEETVSTTPAVKRKRPAEFDPTPSAPLPPRAVVATRTPNKSHRHEKENSTQSDINQIVRGSTPIKSSGKKEIRNLKSIDGLVPLKDPAPILSPERRVLGNIKVATLGTESTAKVGALSLKAKLAGLRAKSGALDV